MKRKTKLDRRDAETRREDRELALWMRPRRDMCWFIGRRKNRLSAGQAAFAWFHLADGLVALGDVDLPKFRHLICNIRAAQLSARSLDPGLVASPRLSASAVK